MTSDCRCPLPRCLPSASFRPSPSGMARGAVLGGCRISAALSAVPVLRRSVLRPSRCRYMWRSLRSHSQRPEPQTRTSSRCGSSKQRTRGTGPSSTGRSSSAWCTSKRDAEFHTERTVQESGQQAPRHALGWHSTLELNSTLARNRNFCVLTCVCIWQRLHLSVCAVY